MRYRTQRTRKAGNMKKKRIIIISIFLALIVMTSVVVLSGAIESYNYDMDPANGIYIMRGMGAAMLLVLGGFVVFYEFDLFYTVYYFFIKPKTVAKSVLNILSNVSLLLVFFSGNIADTLSVSEETNVTVAAFCIYLVLRSVYVLVFTFSLSKE